MQTLHATSAMLCMKQNTLSVLRVLSGLGVSSLQFLRVLKVLRVSSLQFLRVLSGLGVRFQESHT